MSKDINSDTVGQLKGDFPELHLISSDSNKTQHLDIEGGAYPVGVSNIISPTNSEPIEVTAPNDENEKQEKSNAKHKVVCEKKKKVAKKEKPKQKETATPTYYQPVKPQQFIGYCVCKEFDGVITLGSVDSYDHKNNLFKVKYDNCRIEYLEQTKVVKNTPTDKDISKAQEAWKKSNDSKNGGGKKKSPTAGERSTPGGSTPTWNNNDSKNNDSGKRKMSTLGDRSTPSSNISRSEKNEYHKKTCRIRFSN
ncbi:hypothetical protein SESBI_01915 [Sesbania bispinosa]|nr:hypothetical protein SESBI_01915 [Sesbania bispinosa]